MANNPYGVREDVWEKMGSSDRSKVASASKSGQKISGPGMADYSSPYSSGGSSQTAAQKATELGVAEHYSDPSRWTDSSAYQNYMSGLKDSPTGETKTTTLSQPLSQQGFTQAQVDQMIANALSGLTGKYNTLQSQLDTMQTKYDPQIQSLVNQLTQSIQSMPTVEDIMNAPAMQQMQQSIQSQMDQAMKGARADLAARGVFGEGSTPAAERLGQVAGHYGQQLGSLVPSMMSTQQQMQQGQNTALQNLVNMLSGLDARKWQQDISQLQTMLPYTQLTAAQQAQMPLDYFNTMMPWMGVTPAQQQSFIINMLQSMGRTPGDFTQAELDELAAHFFGGGS